MLLPENVKTTKDLSPHRMYSKMQRNSWIEVTVLFTIVINIE